MKVQGVKTSTFGRKLTANEMQEYTNTLTEARKEAGQTGKF